MRIAVAGFAHETNTFAPFPTKYADFGDWMGGGIPVGSDVFTKTPSKFSLHGFAEAARRDGHELVPLIHAFAPPASRLERECFERIMSQMLDALRRVERLDAVFLELHGAMVAEHVEDADAEVLRRVRALIGEDVPLVISLDSHGNVTAEMIQIADGIAAYRTYPHVDMLETGARAYRLLAPLLAGGPRHAKTFRSIPFLMPIYLQTTMEEPCRSLYSTLERLEKEAGEGTCLSFMTGFSLADVPQCRPCVYGYGPNQEQLERAISCLEAEILATEAHFAVNLPDVDTAVRMALSLSTSKPIVMADVQDNAGGGATSDTIWAIEALLRAGAPDAAVGLLYDPDTAALAHAAGEAAEIVVDLGGKGMPGHQPLRRSFIVERLHEGPFDLRGPMLGGTKMNLGKMAQLRCGGVRIVVTSVRTWYVERESFRAVGVNPEEHRIVVVKSTNHYRADFAPITSNIIEFAAPAAVTMNPAKLDYKCLQPGTRLYGNGPVFLGHQQEGRA
ncbi:M81 family metallopeptidase [Microvirga rosea]|uniref:M81 family metallopeptidase n=1 Tax=Microvirga rosea TaxID=2715425 RepID=UPI001D0AE769|nr:M81 family metallopeptidase [Microvirga rosea]MCB8823197.1 M81 family metallopeptidase [Microvirga rosea]